MDMKSLARIVAVRPASVALFVGAAVLVVVAVVLFVVPPPPGKANTGAPIWLVWAAFLLFFGIALRSGKRALWIATAVISVPVSLVNTPDFGGMFSDPTPNALALLVWLAGAFAFASAVTALWIRSRRVGGVTG